MVERYNNPRRHDILPLRLMAILNVKFQRVQLDRGADPHFSIPIIYRFRNELTLKRTFFLSVTSWSGQRFESLTLKLLFA
jgi:hypothetical protein